MTFKPKKLNNRHNNKSIQKSSKNPNCLFIAKDTKVLVVEDNEVNLMVLENMLGLFHVEVWKATSGSIALQMVKQDTYDLIFMDHMMLDMDGIETTRLIRSDVNMNMNTPIIALTAHLSISTSTKFLRVKANEVLQKPLELETLSNVLKRWIPKNKMKVTPQVHRKEEILMVRETESQYDILQQLLQTVVEIDLSSGFKLTYGNYENFYTILRVASKDLATIVNEIENDSRDNNQNGIQVNLHRLENILLNIGANELNLTARRLEEAMKFKKCKISDNEITSLLNRLRQLVFDLEDVLEKLPTYIMENPVEEIQGEDEKKFLTDEEFIARLKQLAYSLSMYDYSSAITECKMLQKLDMGKNQEMLEQIKQYIMNFEYDNANKIVQEYISNMA